MSKKSALLILDGWGLGQKPEADAIAQANTPFVDSLRAQYPHSTLITFGEDVGLPDGQMGNSEVGHLNLGAGRVVYQELARINKAIREKELHQNPVLLEALNKAKANSRAVHFIGLVSDGGVHSHTNHLKALCDIATDAGLKRVYIHAFMDGRDTDPKSGKIYLKDLAQHIEKQPVKIASIIGRYYAMDRDKRWERVKLAYDLMVKGIGTPITDIQTALQERYDKDETDEFLKPLVCAKPNGRPMAMIRKGDLVINFNFRTDRPREISEVLTQKDMPNFDMKKKEVDYVTMTRYDDTYKNVSVLFTKDDLSNTMGDVLAKAGKTQIRIAETEKYPHVTFFFSGGREEPFENERRIMIPSPKVATYDLQPQMSANEITQAVIADMEQFQPDFICLNYANTDMVGHTGIFSAAITAAETVDNCVRQVVTKALEYDYDIIILADHGNSDYMINEDGTPNTAHTKNPVPCIFVSNRAQGATVKNGKLGDVAPTLLSLMGIERPEEMTGNVLVHFS